MAYVTESCTWPSQQIPPEYKILMTRLFQLSDTKGDDIGQQLVNEVFAHDAEVSIGPRKFSGSNGMSKPTLHKKWVNIDIKIDRNNCVPKGCLGRRRL